MDMIKAVLAGDIPVNNFFRWLMTADLWAEIDKVETKAIKLSVQTAEGRSFVHLFTEQPAAEAKQCVKISGWGLFINLPPVDWVEINPLSEKPLHYRPDQFPLLRQWGRALEIETLLTEMKFETAPEESARHLLDHRGYYIALQQQGDEANLMFAPAPVDDARLAAVFTAEDTVEAFIKEVAETQGVSAFAHAVSGADLFGQLSKMELDGLVFNCSGPVPPQVFSTDLIEVVLHAPNKGSD